MVSGSKPTLQYRFCNDDASWPAEATYGGYVLRVSLFRVREVVFRMFLGHDGLLMREDVFTRYEGRTTSDLVRAP